MITYYSEHGPGFKSQPCHVPEMSLGHKCLNSLSLTSHHMKGQEKKERRRVGRREERGWEGIYLS